jgi:hypothetical protein
MGLNLDHLILHVGKLPRYPTLGMPQHTASYMCVPADMWSRVAIAPTSSTVPWPLPPTCRSCAYIRLRVAHVGLLPTLRILSKASTVNKLTLAKEKTLVPSIDNHWCFSNYSGVDIFCNIKYISTTYHYHIFSLQCVNLLTIDYFVVYVLNHHPLSTTS